MGAISVDVGCFNGFGGYVLSVLVTVVGEDAGGEDGDIGVDDFSNFFDDVEGSD